MTTWMPLCLSVLLLIPFVAVRLLPLATTRWGWIMYAANVLSELVVKKVGLDRFLVEWVAAGMGVILLALFQGPFPAALATVGLLLLEQQVRHRERRLLTTAWTHEDRLGPNPDSSEKTFGLARGYPSPSMHPDLILNLVGPFVARRPRYRLGTLTVGRKITVDLIIGNHTIVPTQSGISIQTGSSDAIRVQGGAAEVLAPIAAGSTRRHRLVWEVTRVAGPQQLSISVAWGDIERVLFLKVDACTDSANTNVESVKIQRYPGGCRAAFALRGDMDLYDTSTLQSVEGLEAALGLAARYCMPQTMYLSTRLSLDQQAARNWAQHYRVDRGADQIPRFITWMRDNIELVHRSGYPFESEKPYLIELGNHGHLHFGTDTAAAPENDWTVRARMGAGQYPWLGDDRTSLAEQRDNAIEARRWCEKLFDYSPKSWAMPDRTRDEHTPAAMEAAGCEVLSDSDIRTIHNVLLQPPPHFPPKCGSVELTKRYPGDPEHIFHVAMNQFWIHRAHRLGIPVVFMCHQHMAQYVGHGCARFTEAVLRYALTAFHGDLWIDTVYGLGTYWRDVLSPKSKLTVDRTENDIEITNTSELSFGHVPLDVQFSGGGRATYLVDLPAASSKGLRLP